jgi:hypothetical protein
VETDFWLEFQDQSDPGVFGQGSAGLVVNIAFAGGPIGSPDELAGLKGPFAGDEGTFTILYPRIQADPFVYSGAGDALRGTDLAEGAFAVVAADDFFLTKVIETNWIEFTIEKTYVETWYREGCDFLLEFDGDGNLTSADPDTGFLFPTPECESPNNGGDGDSFPQVRNDISFFTPDTFDFVTSTTDGGFLNYQGTGMTWYPEPAFEDIGGAFQFQLVGPKFAGDTNRNTGALQAYLPAAYVDEIFGADFNVADPSWQPVRVDSGPGTRTVQDLTDVAQLSDPRSNGGLLIEVSSYGFSAPAFSFASSDREPILPLDETSTGESGDESPGGIAAVPTLAATGPNGSWSLSLAGGVLLVILGATLIRLAHFSRTPSKTQQR